MILINLVLVCVSTFFIQNAAAGSPNFRIMAPPFVCPKDKDAVIDKGDNTVITKLEVNLAAGDVTAHLKLSYNIRGRFLHNSTIGSNADTQVEYHWVVRWHPLVAPTQQFTLALWHTVRELELKLNVLQMEPNIFIINNTELLTGVNYIFNVTARTHYDDVGTTKVFQIDNNRGDPKLLIEGQSDMFCIFLIGAQLVYADIDFILEAEVTTCYRTHDYYFVWTVTSAEDSVSVADVKGSRLVIRANTLTPGKSYDVLCQVYRHSNGEFIAQNNLPFRVLHRKLSVNFNVDLLVVSQDVPFKLYTDINQLDYLNKGTTVAWECSFGGEPVDSYYATDAEGTLSFPLGLSYVGEYLISLTVNIQGQSIATQTMVRVTPLEPRLPVIKMLRRSRMLNEGSVSTFRANISNVRPGCSIIWYFRSQHCLVSMFSTTTDICDDNPHGTRISEPINFYSLEENFLSELTDYTNETETGWKPVSANMNAAAGRIRVAAKCPCQKEENCTGVGEVYADVIYQLNEKPDVKYVRAMPDIGTAMETVFRISTTPVMDTTRPLRYTFYCDLANNDTLLLGSYLEHTAVETLLPYIKGGVFVWVEICDSLGACSTAKTYMVSVAPGEARTVDALLEDVRTHVRRCELMVLRRLSAAAVVTYTNAGQEEALSKFTTSLLNALGGIEERCIENNYDQYNNFTYWLQSAGIDTAKLM